MPKEKEKEKVKSNLVVVSVPVVAVNIARAEANRRKESGIPMSIGAVISEAVMEKYGKVKK